MKRKLSQSEIQEIITNFPINTLIPRKIAENQRGMILLSILPELQSVEIKEEKIPIFISQLYDEYFKSLVSPGESVGIICAQSIGERQTQTTLSSFHSCGMSIRTVTTGVPRFTELLNVTKNQKMSNMEINVQAPLTLATQRYLNKLMVHTIFSDLVTHKKYILDNTSEPTADTVIFYLNHSKLYLLGITVMEIAEIIENTFKNVVVLDITPEYDPSITLEFFIDISYILDCKLCGISGINKVFYELSPEASNGANVSSFKISTEGSNLQYVLAMTQDDFKLPIGTISCGNSSEPKHISHDTLTVMTNDLWQIYEILGVEAARAFLISAFIDVVNSDGSWINPCHVELLVEVMTSTGSLIPMNRYGLKLVDPSVISRSCFEECLNNFVIGATTAMYDNTKSSCVDTILGRHPRLGTSVMTPIMELK
jgi:hypothetical protein